MDTYGFRNMASQVESNIIMKEYMSQELDKSPKPEIKVCMLTYALPPEHSGAALQALRLAGQLRRGGVKIFFICPTSEVKNLKVKEVEGVKVIRIFKGSLFWKIIAPLRFFISLIKERKKFDIIHVHGFGYLGKIAIIVGFMLNKKVILKATLFQEDDVLSIKKSRFGALDFWFYKQASHFIATTQSFYERCVNAGILSTRVSLIPNGVDIQLFSPVSTEIKIKLRKKLGLPPRKKILIYAGIIKKVKGIDFLLEVIEVISRHDPNVTLVLLGPVEKWVLAKEVDYVKGVLDKINDLSERGIVSYPGKVNNVNEFFQAADIFVSASWREGLPNVVLEAMACGLPVVVLDIPEVYQWILSDGKDGIIVKERDVEGFSKTVADLIKNRPLYDSMGENACKKSNSKYASEMVCNSYITLYSELLKGKND